MPTYLITAPDGRKFRVTGEGSKEDALAHIQSQYATKQPAKQEAPLNPTQDMGMGGRFLTGMGKAFSDVGRGARQLSTEIGNTIGLGRLSPVNFGDQAVQQLRDDAALARERDAPLMETRAGRVGNLAGNIAATVPASMIPGANTVAGAGLIGGGLGAMQPATSGTERMVNAGLGLGLGAGGQYLGGKMAGYAGRKLGERQTQAALTQAQNAPRDALLKESVEAGFSVPPATTNPSALNTALESIAGKAATQSAASAKNQTVTNALIRRDLGLADDIPLTRDALKSVRTQGGQAYEAIKQTGDVLADEKFLDDVIELVGDSTEINKNFPGAKVSAGKEVTDLADSLLQEKFTASAAVEYAKRLRSQAKTNFKSFDNPEKLQLAHAQWEAAGVLEDAIGRNLQRKGLSELVEQFQQARTIIAKSHSAEAALNEGTGNIVASKLVTQLRKGKPLSGGFEQVAKFASVAPKAMREPTESGGVSALNAAIFGGGIGMGQPGLVAVPIARLLTRRAILKQGLQRHMALPNYTPSASGTAALQAGRGMGRIGGPLAASVYATEQ